MPKNFPGVNGNPTEGVPSFVCLDGLPPDWHHLVIASKPLGRAIHHASLAPTTTGELLETQWKQIDLAEQAAQNVVTTIQRIREWSKQNLKPATPAPTPSRKR